MVKLKNSRNSFALLYRLDNEPAGSIRDRIRITDHGTAALQPNWIRISTGRTGKELEDLEALVGAFEFNNNGVDTCSWSLSNNGIFFVRSLSTLIDKRLLGDASISNETMKNNLVPKKIEIFVWRACQKRLPVRIELDKRGIDLNSVRCPLCDDDLETVDHSLIFCKCAMDVWDRVFAWWGFGSMSNLSINEVFVVTKP
ncbi:uncharacterized protein [Rutidosis leptorrhynchoides]|uniref:uncharacterized protein n=1 Tax=Rutidosis leptorrhynchoides TaxID=125765 RepID=UPI003A98F752